MSIAGIRSNTQTRLPRWRAATGVICDELLFRGFLLWYLTAWLLEHERLARAGIGAITRP